MDPRRVAIVFAIVLSTGVLCTSPHLSKRAVVYQEGATSTILAALSIPVDIENKNVYVAINFSANYISPQNASTYTRPFDRFHEKNKRDLPAGPISRSSFYKSIVRELNRFGMDGKLCLMSTICAVNSAPVEKHNGVIGSLMQLVFSPSLSHPENDLPGKFYEAEKLGRQENCLAYKDKCPVNILDLITRFD